MPTKPKQNRAAPQPIEAEWIALDDLAPWDKNPRINDAAVPAVAESIRRFGWGNPILVRRTDSVVIAGHTRLKAARSLGMDKVLVRWMDLDPAEARALALADNKLSELAAWDDGLLREVLADLEQDGVDLDGLGWSEEELEKLLQQMPDIDLAALDDETHLNGESEYAILRMSVRKDEVAEVEAAAASDWGDPEAGSGKAERIGSLFLFLWRQYQNG